MATTRAIIKYSVVGLLLVIVGGVLFLSFVPDRYWPIPACSISTLSEAPSPSKAMVARFVRTTCVSKSAPEATIFLGYFNKPKSLGQLVFAAPAYFLDETGNQRPVDLHIEWKGEDHLVVDYPESVRPNLPGSRFRSDRLDISITSQSRTLTSNRALQSGPVPAAELKRYVTK